MANIDFANKVILTLEEYNRLIRLATAYQTIIEEWRTDWEVTLDDNWARYPSLQPFTAEHSDRIPADIIKASAEGFADAMLNTDSDTLATSMMWCIKNDEHWFDVTRGQMERHEGPGRYDLLAYKPWREAFNNGRDQYLNDLKRQEQEKQDDEGSEAESDAE